MLGLVISFAILIFAWHKPRFHHVGGDPLPEVMLWTLVSLLPVAMSDVGSVAARLAAGT